MGEEGKERHNTFRARKKKQSEIMNGNEGNLLEGLWCNERAASPCCYDAVMGIVSAIINRCHTVVLWYAFLNKNAWVIM